MLFSHLAIPSVKAPDTPSWTQTLTAIPMGTLTVMVIPTQIQMAIQRTTVN